ncbi:MAG TPA: hypothetical protein VKR58_14980, partial [Aquella sp.]|nr:hypothetical protein [Aquella sp.]
MKQIKIIFSIIFINWVFMLAGCGGGGGGPGGPGGAGGPGGNSTTNAIQSYSINGTVGTITGTSILVSLPSGTNVTALVATFSAPGYNLFV